MKNLKNLTLMALICAITCTLGSCDKGKSPNISFKTGTGYVSSNVYMKKGSSITMGINASKAEDKDVLKHFDISKSVNSGAVNSVYSQDLGGVDNFSYDYTTTLDTASGVTNKFIFTIVNRDGLTNQVNLTVTTTN
jgi:hypothetical protein